MKPKEAQVLIDAIKKLVDTNHPTVVEALATPAHTEPVTAGNGNGKAPSGDEFERMYLRIKNRFIDEARLDPILLQLLTTRPEIVVEVEPRVISLDGATLKGRIARLMASGFFKASCRQGTVRAELARTGSDVNGGNLSTAINDYVKDGFLTREGDGYVLAPGVKVTEKELRVK